MVDILSHGASSVHTSEEQKPPPTVFMSSWLFSHHIFIERLLVAKAPSFLSARGREELGRQGFFYILVGEDSKQNKLR